MSSLYKALVGLFSAGLLFGLGMWLGLTVIAPTHGEHGRASVAAVPLGAATSSDAATPRRIERPKPGEATMANREADRKLTPKLTPVHPAEPGAPKPAIDTADRQSPAVQSPIETTGVASHEQQQPQQTPIETTGSASVEPQRPQSNPARAQSIAPAPARDIRKSEPQIRAASLSSADGVNRCDVRACAGAYKSFRESDCSYQPFSGPRQLCVSPPTTTQRQESQPASYRARAQAPARAHDADLDGAVRAVERLTAGRRWSTEPDTSNEPSRYDRAPRVYVLPDDEDE